MGSTVLAQGRLVPQCDLQACVPHSESANAAAASKGSAASSFCRTRAEVRRVSAALQQLTRERDATAADLASATSQLGDMAALRAQLQRAEAALAEANQARDEARALAADHAVQCDKLKAQLVGARWWSSTRVERK